MSYPSQADPVAPQRIIDPVIPAAFIPIWGFAQSHDNDSLERKSSWAPLFPSASSRHSHTRRVTQVKGREKKNPARPDSSKHGGIENRWT